MSPKQLDPNWKSQLIARAWREESFREKLLRNPRAAAAELGYNIPDSWQFKVLEEDADKVYLVLPQKPAGAELSDEALDQVAGGDVFTAPSASCSDSSSCGPGC